LILAFSILIDTNFLNNYKLYNYKNIKLFILQNPNENEGFFKITTKHKVLLKKNISSFFEIKFCALKRIYLRTSYFITRLAFRSDLSLLWTFFTTQHIPSNMWTKVDRNSSCLITPTTIISFNPSCLVAFFRV
jgi:hypothetical protein